MYTPTKQELEELRFKQEGDLMVYGGSHNGYIGYDARMNIFSTTPIYVYPQSLEDLKTLIRILTPQ